MSNDSNSRRVLEKAMYGLGLTNRSPSDTAKPIGGSGPPITVTIECPFCDRAPELDNHLAAQAWVSGHIQAAHSDELPAFENDD